MKRHIYLNMKPVDEAREIFVTSRSHVVLGNVILLQA